MSDNNVVMPNDYEAVKTILENAEIDYEVMDGNGITISLELENGIKFHFGDDGELTGIDV